MQPQFIHIVKGVGSGSLLEPRMIPIRMTQEDYGPNLKLLYRVKVSPRVR